MSVAPSIADTQSKIAYWSRELSRLKGQLSAGQRSGAASAKVKALQQAVKNAQTQLVHYQGVEKSIANPPQETNPRSPYSGGGGSSGGGGGSTGGTTDQTSEAKIEDEVRRKYGYLSSYLDDKTIGPILKQAAKEGWDTARLQGALYKTAWWKKTSDTSRLFDAELKTDPASAAEKIRSKQAEIWDLSKNLGYANISTNSAKAIATQALREGWSQAELVDKLGNEIKYNGPLSGMAGETETQIRKLVSDYGIPMADSVMQKKIKQVILGEQDVEGFRNDLIEQAKSLVPTASKALDRGETLEQWADPYRQIYAQTTGANPDDFSILDPKFQKALVQIDDKGNRSAMAFDEWTKTVKTDPIYGYDKSANGIQEGSSFIQKLQQKFGFQA